MSNEKIIGAVQDSIASRQKENQAAEAEAYAEIQTLQRHNYLKEATVSGREISRNFSEEISKYSLDSLLPGLAVKIHQGELPQSVLPQVMNQLAGYAILENVRAKAIKAVQDECVIQPESALREFEKINFAVLRRHRAI
jgi:hypothetical protein